MAIKLDQRPVISAGDTDFVAIDYTEYLDDDELLTGIPTVVEVATTDLTLSGKTVNTEEVRIIGRDIPQGKAVQFSVSGAKSGTEYLIRVTATTDKGRTAIRDIVLRAV
jgi:hypothetical protein